MGAVSGWELFDGLVTQHLGPIMQSQSPTTELQDRDVASGSLAAVLLIAQGMPSWLSVEVLLISTTLALLAIGGWWGSRVYRRRLQRSRQQQRELSSADAPIKNSALDHRLRAVMDSGFLHPSPSTDDISAEKLFFASDSDPLPRRCPECDRTFPGVFDICPFDSVRLQDDLQRTTVGEDHSRHLSRHYCSGCERRFELTSKYCYHDGKQLHPDSEGISQNAIPHRVCRSCGWESKEKNHQNCPRDGQPLLTIDPTDRRFIPPPFPYNRCRKCGHIGAPVQTECPVDGSLLLPELNARHDALPPTGYGPRRQMCTECGTQFGDQCNFCSYDGSVLVPIN